jgi:hypothetical protein
VGWPAFAAARLLVAFRSDVGRAATCGPFITEGSERFGGSSADGRPRMRQEIRGTLSTIVVLQVTRT